MSQKIQGILAVGIISVSALCGMAYVIEKYDTSAAFWYVFLLLWAIGYCISAK